MSRAAVQPGADGLRVAVCAVGEPPVVVGPRDRTGRSAGPPGDPPRAPGAPAPAELLAPALAELVALPLAELVLVHPATWPAARVAAWLRDHGPLAAVVRAEPAPVAAVRAVQRAPDRRADGGVRGGRLVLDVGAGGAELTRLGSDGAVLAARRLDVGGRRLDRAVRALLDRSGPTPPAPVPDRDRDRSDEVRLDGDRLDGDRADGDRADGDRADGDRADGDRADGDRADGDRADGDRADGDRADGDRADGDRADGDRADGDRADGDRADGDRADGDRADGDRADQDLPDRNRSGRDRADQHSPDRNRDPRARRVREALALLPDADGLTAERVDPVLAAALAPLVEAVCRAVHEAGGPLPVLLVGGVARTPLLARLLDAAGIPDVRPVDRPEDAAVLGALATAAGPDHPATGPSTGPEHPATGPSTGPPAGFPIAVRLPPPPRDPRRPVRRAVLAAGLALVAAAVIGLAAGAPPAPGVPVPDPGTGLLVQYGYRLDLPAGWEHTGGLPERRRVLLTPAATPRGSDLIAVELSPLGYDSAAEPARAAAELLAVYRAGGTQPGRTGTLTGYRRDVAFAGRTVTAYREVEPHSSVDWYVLLDGDAQLSVGCRHTPASASAVAAACATVVGSLTAVPPG